MSEKRNIRDLFGIDYLLGDNKALLPSSGPAVDSRGLVEQARQVRQMTDVLKQLRAAPDSTSHLRDLVDPTGLDLPTLLEVTNALEKNQLIHVIERDRFGNYLIQMTRQGLETLDSLAS
ncbi:MAG TPA: hypothetical protein VG013_17490 [Gemmataceae bacterium]|nr:hypothetical protein [Gemmataceae bacterium]